MASFVLPHFPSQLKLIDDVFAAAAPARLAVNQRARADVLEEEKAYVIFLDVPGLSKDDITISYQEQLLTIAGTRPPVVHATARSLINERPAGEFKRSFIVKDIDETAISAALDLGVLRVEVPKKQAPLAKRISIVTKDAIKPHEAAIN